MTTAGKDNLTRAEAQERAGIIGATTYAIELDLRLGEVTFESNTTVTFECKQPGSSTFIDLDAVELSEVTLNGRTLDIKDTPDGRIPLEDLQASNTLVVRGVCEYSRTGTGLHRTVDPVDKQSYTYTQFEPFDAHRVFACFDQPDIKGTFAFDVEVPEEWVVISNNRPTSQPPAGKSGRWIFGATPIMSTYLAAICAGPYVGVFDKADLKNGSVELGWWCRRSLEKYLDPDELFLLTKQGFEFYEELFDYPYMLDSYDQVFCPEYKFGAMENLGCVTYTENYLFRSKVTEATRESRAEVILHEMAHMWFGDLVTMKWWNDLWLNESFATYISYLAKERATRFTNSWVSFASGEKMWAYRQDQLPTTHPIVADIPDVEATHLNFDGITYAKGASVLKQLVAWVGEDAFFKGLRTYFKTHEWGNTELPDFLAPLAEESGRDLAAWSKIWLETAGVNTITIEGNAVVQDAPSDWPTIRPHRMGIGLFDGGDGLTLRREIETDVVGERTEIKELADEKPADLVLPNYKDLAYTKIRFDERSLATLVDGLRTLGDPLSRTLCWGASWDMVRDAQNPARRYLDLVLNNIDGETDIGVVGDLLANSGAAVLTWGDPANRTAGRATLCAAARERMLESEAGSDLQLVWARYFIVTARSDEDVTFVRGLLDGTEEVKGLEIDTDVRWMIVTALARIGKCDNGRCLIDAELERDPTDQGERYAAAARAARPTAEAKAEAWEHVTQDPEITLAMTRAVLGALQYPDQDDVLRPYADRYFDELLEVWKKRPLDLGLSFTAGAYPRLYTQGVLDRTDELLAGDVPPPVRRILREQKDESARVMRARQADNGTR
jgi:aminopeptidase N